jgi:hypothetical protein
MAGEGQEPRTVFISYAHESDALKRSVSELAAWLKQRGCVVITDEPYAVVPPREGWQTWMDKGIADADVVLVVCTPRLKRRYEMTEERDVGFGGTFEGAIITQHLYAAQMRNDKFFPILPDGGSPDDIPTRLKSWHNNHRFPSGNQLILQLCNQAGSTANSGRREGVSGAPDPRAGPDAVTVTAPKPVAKALASPIEWHPILATARTNLERQFDHPAFKRSGTLALAQTKVPPALISELDRADNGVGARSVNALIRLVQGLSAEMGEASGNWSAQERVQMRSRLETAMGVAARLCLDPRKLDELGRSGEQTLAVAASSIPAATLPLRPNPGPSLARYVDADGLPAVRDRHAITMIEGGELVPAQHDTVRTMAAHFSETGAVPTHVDDRLINRVQGLAYDAAQEGQERLIVFDQDHGAGSQALCDWINARLGLRIVKVTGADDGLYLFAENLLLPRLQTFLKIFDQPEWKSP